MQICVSPGHIDLQVPRQVWLMSASCMLTASSAYRRGGHAYGAVAVLCRMHVLFAM